MLIFWQHAAYLVALPLYICGCMFWMDRLPLNWAAAGMRPGPSAAEVGDPGLVP